MAPDSTTYEHTIKSPTYITYHYTHHVCKPELQIYHLRSERGEGQDVYVQQNHDDYHQHR